MENQFHFYEKIFSFLLLTVWENGLNQWLVVMPDLTLNEVRYRKWIGATTADDPQSFLFFSFSSRLFEAIFGGLECLRVQAHIYIRCIIYIDFWFSLDSCIWMYASNEFQIIIFNIHVTSMVINNYENHIRKSRLKRMKFSYRTSLKRSQSHNARSLKSQEISTRSFSRETFK